MDHIGEFPLAFVDDAPFTGRVYATPATRDAADISLADGATILAKEYGRKQDGYTKMLKEIAAALFVLKEKKPGEK
jgi:Cft2 family RNA processing exonuclease